MAKTKWTVDTNHSEIGFSVRHMMISTAKGVFNDFDANIEMDPNNLEDANIEVSIDVNSIDTRNEDRDNHLRSDDFFDVENHPKIIFKATDIQKKNDNNSDVTGDLTLRGTTKPVTFDITFGGEQTDPWGNTVAGFSGETSINRKEFGLTWNSTLETGGVLVSEDVKINLELELQKEA